MLFLKQNMCLSIGNSATTTSWKLLFRHANQFPSGPTESVSTGRKEWYQIGTIGALVCTAYKDKRPNEEVWMKRIALTSILMEILSLTSEWDIWKCRSPKVITETQLQYIREWLETPSVIQFTNDKIKTILSLLEANSRIR